MTEVFIGRQPILDRERRLFGYELLFRGQAQDTQANFVDGDAATSQVMWNAVNEFGLDKLVDGRNAFVNITENFMRQPKLVVLPTRKTFLEILESTQVDDRVIMGCRELKRRGYSLALDDYHFQPNLEPLLELVDLIKVDVPKLSEETLELRFGDLQKTGAKLLAEKVETPEQYTHLSDLGFDYFQGYYFAKPNTLSAKKIESNRAILIQLISKLHNTQTELRELIEIINRDVALSVGVMRYANSPANGFVRKIGSVQQAVVLLGRITIRNWATLLLLIRENTKPNELFRLTLYRARYCELLAKAANHDQADTFFTVGLLASLDAILDMPITDVLQQIGIESGMQLAIIEKQGLRGKALQCAMAMSLNQPDDAKFGALPSSQLLEIHNQARAWADESIALLV